MCRAAVHAGADAVYVGVPDFNARGRAPSLSQQELADLIKFCHLYGVRVFLALNILIFEEELEPLCERLVELVKLSPDAFIVQDIGLCRILQVLAPHISIHASTQMTVTSSESIKATADLGITRYVLGRENSLADIQRIREDTDSELEVFVHGALCVSYSGQCLTSESFGGRSANRGQCAQSCRLPYELEVDGVTRDLGEMKYLVSPQDLCGLEEVPQLSELGVNSFKIEGRLKSAEYVASTVVAYKQALAGAVDAAHLEAELAPIYSRGFFSGWLNGVNHQQLVDGRFSSHLGLELGKVSAVREDSIVVDCSSSLVAAGDGVVFVDFRHAVSPNDRDKKVGAPVFEVRDLKSHKQCELQFANDFMASVAETGSIKVGMVAFCNSSPRREKELHRLWEERQQLRRVPIDVRVSGKAGEPLSFSWSDDCGNQVSVASTSVLDVAKKAPLEAKRVQEECGALEGTAFRLRDFNWAVHGRVFLHNKEIRTARQAASQKLAEARLERYTPEIDVREVQQVLAAPGQRGAGEWVAGRPSLPQLTLLLRSAAQVTAVLGSDAALVILDFEYGKDYAPTVAQLKAAGHRVGIATTRIHKPRENAHLLHISRLEPDAVLIRNLGALEYFTQLASRQGESKQYELIGDFSLNVTNHLTLDWLIQRGLSRVVPSYDLNIKQLLTLLETGRGNRCEVTIHHYIAAFHMEHCVFASCLSNGTSYRDCGRPCEKHRVDLIDRLGVHHPLTADAECRNTMFNGTPQSAVRFIPDCINLGVRSFRIEALLESGAEVRKKIDAYARVLRGEVSPEVAYQQLAAIGLVGGLGGEERYGVTEGQLVNFKTHQNRKKSPDVTRGLPA